MDERHDGTPQPTGAGAGAPAAGAGRARARLGGLALGVWLVAVLVAGASLMSTHLLTLPGPTSTDELGRAVAEARVEGERDRWFAVHILYAACGCSKRVVNSLIDRGDTDASSDAAELVVWVGSAEDDDTTARLRARGYRVDTVTPADLERRYSVTSAPMLVVADPAGALRYVGGYTARKRGPDIVDQDILGALRRGAAVETLPLFGCAVSRELQGQTDPFGLKYRAP